MHSIKEKLALLIAHDVEEINHPYYLLTPNRNMKTITLSTLSLSLFYQYFESEQTNHFIQGINYTLLDSYVSV